MQKHDHFIFQFYVFWWIMTVFKCAAKKQLFRFHFCRHSFTIYSVSINHYSLLKLSLPAPFAAHPPKKNIKKQALSLLPTASRLPHTAQTASIFIAPSSSSSAKKHCCDCFSSSRRQPIRPMGTSHATKVRPWRYNFTTPSCRVRERARVRMDSQGSDGPTSNSPCRNGPTGWWWSAAQQHGGWMNRIIF